MTYRIHDKIRCRTCKNTLRITEKECDTLVEAAKIVDRKNKEKENYTSMSIMLDKHMKCCKKPNYFWVC